MKKIPLKLSFLLIVLSLSSFISPEEGMFPLSDIKSINFKKVGFEIKPENLYNPNGTSLIDALVQLSGCTGSFISKDGLIITNHHCAFNAVSLASTPLNDYLKNGFVAPTKDLEIQAKGLTVRITDGYEDVSKRILEKMNAAKNPSERVDILKTESAKIVEEAENKDKSIKAQVSEMFIGRSYVLFKYKIIKDIRLVYVPQRSIGEFGGETDNWVWPRHTGDFSFVRAYVDKEGNPADFSKENIPYHPKNFLKVNPNGVNEGDFVFILGYPGRTFRHRPAAFIEYQQKFVLPYISKLYEWQNLRMLESSKFKKEDELIQASRIKSKANVLKNFNGKLKGLAGLNLVDKKREEEKEMMAFVNSDPNLKSIYSSLIPNIENMYSEISKDAQRDLVLIQLYPSSFRFSAALKIANFKDEFSMLAKGDKTIYYNDKKDKVYKEIADMYANLVPQTDFDLLLRAFTDALDLPESQRVLAIDKYIRTIPGKDNTEKTKIFLIKTLKLTALLNLETIKLEFNKPVEKFFKIEDNLIKLSRELKVQISELDSIKKEREGELNKLMADFVELKSQFKKTNFVPDANSTLRLTYGRIKGYSPVDATYMAPITSLRGAIQKSVMGGDFELSDKVKELYFKKEFGRWKNNKLNDVPVAILYNTDTTGGNSGSPIMNAKGELIGVNFDRAYEATINDYAWDDSYSRSIGVDIRYVLWVAEKVDNAKMILEELGIK